MNLRTTNNSLMSMFMFSKQLCIVRVSRIWNTLPDELRKLDISLQKFKRILFDYYFSVTTLIFDAHNIQLTSKTINSTN